MQEILHSIPHDTSEVLIKKNAQLLKGKLAIGDEATSSLQP